MSSIHDRTYVNTPDKPKKQKFVAFRRTILSDYKIESQQVEVECETVVEAAMAYFNQYACMPTEVYSITDRNEKMKDYEEIRQVLFETQKQRDNFAKSMNIAETERSLAVQQIEKLHDLAQAALAAMTLPVTELP